MQAMWTKERNRDASLSKQVAIRRFSFTLLKKHSTKCCSLYKDQPHYKGSMEFDLGGMQKSVLQLEMYSLKLKEPYASCSQE